MTYTQQWMSEGSGDGSHPSSNDIDAWQAAQVHNSNNFVQRLDPSIRKLYDSMTGYWNPDSQSTFDGQIASLLHDDWISGGGGSANALERVWYTVLTSVVPDRLHW